MNSAYDFYIGEYRCPLCQAVIKRSDYLKSAIEDEKVEYIANLIVHYRHQHLKFWDRCWGPGGNRYRSGWFKKYDEEKAKVNERAKRQLVRGCHHVFKSVGIEVIHFAQLQNTEPETIAVCNKFLNGPIEVEVPPKFKKSKMKDLTDDDPISFGKHEGTKLANCPPDYLLWIWENNKCPAPVRKYIEANLDVILAEIKQKQK